MERWKSEDFAVLKVSLSCHVIDWPHLNSIITEITQQLGETAAALTILVSIQTLSCSVNPSKKA
jgi:hypothetical protein